MKATRVPSGDQAGGRCPTGAPEKSGAGFFDTFVCDEPSLRMTYISELPSRSDTNAKKAPSGDQAGLNPPATVRRTGESSRPTTYMSPRPPSPADVNAIRLPSGDHVGPSPGRSVSLRSPEPSLLIA